MRVVAGMPMDPSCLLGFPIAGATLHPQAAHFYHSPAPSCTDALRLELQDCLGSESQGLCPDHDLTGATGARVHT